MPGASVLAALLLAAMVSESAAQEPPHAEAAPHAAETGEHAVAGGDHAAGDEHDAHGDDHSGPPLKPETDLVIWTIVTFVLFLVVLKAVAWKPLIAGLDQRESKYRALLADAQADRDKAVRLLADYDQKLKAAQSQVDEIIAEARRDAERTKADIVAAANREAEATRRRALDDIGRARDQAISSLFEHMHANVLAATEKVLARTMSDADHDRLINEALAEVSSR